jgi:spore germination protein YaaH
MRFTTVLVVLATMLAMVACNNKKTETKVGPTTEADKPVPSAPVTPRMAKEKAMPVKQLGVNRENILVWMDATRNDTQRAFDSLDANRKNIGVVSPVLYKLKDGKVILHEKIGPNTVGDIKYACDKNEPKIKIRPLFGNIDENGAHGDEAVKILQNPALQKEALTMITKVASDPNYIGVDIDWEGIPVDKIHLLADFLAKLAPPIHRMGKTVSVVLEAWNVRNEWRQIADVVDFVEFMTYPEHNPGTGPGPIASLGWSSRNLEMALQVVPRAKLVFCMPLFGYSWIPSAMEITWSDWEKEKARNSAKTLMFKRDADGNPSTFTSATSEAWYEDAYSINQKMLMAEKYRITQFGFWQIGGEDPDVWKSLN